MGRASNADLRDRRFQHRSSEGPGKAGGWLVGRGQGWQAGKGQGAGRPWEGRFRRAQGLCKDIDFPFW